MKKILVTGSLGLVGSACLELFSEKGWSVVGIDNNGRADFFGTSAHQNSGYNVDVRNERKINELFQHHEFDAIIHAAGQPSHDYATDHVIEDFEVNTLGTLNLLEATRKYCPDATFVYVSTDKVYGENMKRGVVEKVTRYHSEQPFAENLGLDFAGYRSFFGCSKVAADLYVQQYAAQGMNVGVFRPGCITGKNHEGAEQHGFLAYLTKCIKDGKEYKIYGHKGKQVRDQIHAMDLAKAFSAFIEKPTRGGVYNIGGGPERSISVIEAIGKIASELGYKLGDKIPYSFHEARKGDRIWDVHDVSKFRKDYPEWNYEYSLQDIIKDVCAK